ncbi:FhaA domain-containing protein [Streptomyces sp. NPDC003032]
MRAGHPTTMGLIGSVEHAMEKWTDTLWTLLLPPRQERCEVVAILHRQCDENALILDRERTVVPNAFVVELPPPVHRQLREAEAEVDYHLAAQVRRHAAEQGYTFAGPVAVDLRASGSSAVGRFRIHSHVVPLDGPEGVTPRRNGPAAPA